MFETIEFQKIEVKENHMTIEEVRACQLKQLEALKFIDEICKKNGLTYFVHTGTLLGAARHSGYIPWDMDTDVLMPEKDAVEFLNIVQKMNSPIYSVISQYKSWACSDRLIAKTARCFGPAAIYEEDKYLHIDIYSYGNAKKHPLFLSRYYDFKTRIIHRLIEYREGRKIFQNIFGKIVIQALQKLLSRYSSNQLREKLKNQAITQRDSDRISVYNSFYGFSKETYPKYFFDEIIFLQFEDMMAPVPKHYDEVLSQLYGDWRKLPPENNRYPDYLAQMVYEELS